MCQRHTFCGIRDQIPRDKRIFHADMPHRDTVTDCDRRKYHRHAASLCNAEFYRGGDLIQIHVAGHDLIVGTDDPDHRFAHFFLCKAQCIEQTSVRSLLHSLFYVITSHKYLSSISSHHHLIVYILSEIKSPIIAVPTCSTPARLLSSCGMMSIVRKPSSRTFLTAASTASASLSRSKE